MKKLFTLFTAILFAGSLFAAEGDKHDFSQSLQQLLNNNAPINSINIAEQAYTVKEVIVSFRYNKDIENAVTMEVKVAGSSWGTATSENTGQNYTTRSFKHEAASGAIVISFTNNTGSGTGHGTFYVNNIQLVEGEASAVPSILASDVALGTITTYDATYEKDVKIAVTGLNLTEAITYESSSNTKLALSGTLTKEGGELTAHVAAPEGAFDETITLTSGSTTKTIHVTATIKQIKQYTVAEALAAYAASTLASGDSLLVRGVVKAIGARTSAGKLQVTLSEPNDADKEFLLYNIKSLNNADFTSATSETMAIDANNKRFAPGDTLIAKGKLSVYDSKPQIATDGFLTAIMRDKASIQATLIASPENIAVDCEAAEGKSVTLAYIEWEADATAIEAQLFSDEACTQNITLGGWVSNFAFNDAKTQLTFDIAANTGAARTAYVKISAQNASEQASAVVKVTQEEYLEPEDYVLTAFADIKSTDVVIITETKSNVVYALSSATPSSNPGAVVVTPANNKISAKANAKIFWNIVKSGDNYIIYPDGITDKWLSSGGSNTDVRINTGEKKNWNIQDAYLYNVDANRHMGVYSGTSGNDWRCYQPTSGGAVSSSISGQTLGFYVKDNGSGTSLSNTAADSKAVKTIVNGQLLITRDGKTYNVLGTLVR